MFWINDSFFLNGKNAFKSLLNCHGTLQVVKLTYMYNMAVINWKWSEMSLIKIKALLSMGTLVFVRSNLAFHAYVFFIIQILVIFGQIACPPYFWSITYLLYFAFFTPLVFGSNMKAVVGLHFIKALSYLKWGHERTFWTRKSNRIPKYKVIW